MTKLFEFIPELCPDSILTDFEPALIKYTRKLISKADHHSCFFHMSQCVCRNIQGLPEIRQNYYNEPEFNLEIQKLSALSFVKETDVIAAYDKLLDTKFFNNNIELLKPLLDYFDDTLIDRLLRNHKCRTPKFEIAMWNRYDVTVNDLPRTNNAIEAWHRAFLVSVGVHHAALYNFIKFLKLEQNNTEIKWAHEVRGDEKTTKSKKRMTIDDHIFSLALFLQRERYVRLFDRISCLH